MFAVAGEDAEDSAADGVDPDALTSVVQVDVGGGE